MLSSIGQVIGSVFKWEGCTEMFIQEDCYHNPEVVKMEFQAAQGQLAWLGSRNHETSHHLALVEWELKHLWVMVRLEQKYLHHLIKEHLAPLQSSISLSSCQCAIVGDFQQSPIPASFWDLHTSVSIGPGSPPPLKSCLSEASFISFWEELNTIIDPEVLPVQLQGGMSNEAKVAASEDSEEAWEDVSEGGTGGGGSGGEDILWCVWMSKMFCGSS